MMLHLLRPVFQILAGSGGGGKLLVFIFHRVLANADPLLPAEPNALQFEWMAQWIGTTFQVMPFGQAIERLKGGTLPRAAACITFDDGYRDNYSIALPTLQRHGLTGTFFIATAFLDGGRMWNDDIIEAVRALPSGFVDWSAFGLGRYDLTTPQRKAASIGSVLEHLKYLPHEARQSVARVIARRAGVDERSELMMSSDNVKALRAAGMEIGGHTHTHPILRSLSDRDAMTDIAEGKERLEAILNERVEVFAYPNGNPQKDLTPRHVELVKAAGFLAAATTARDVGRSHTDPFLVPRFTPWDRTPVRFASRCAAALAGRL